MAPNALVTGGTGFVGRHVVRKLLEAGWRVRAVVLASERDRPLEHPNLESHVGDVTKPESLRGSMADVDAVFHLAALVDSWIRDPRDYVRVNVNGTDHVIDEALRAGVRRFIFTSSMSGIGVTPGAVMREDSPPGKVFGPYEASKAEAERHVARAAQERGLPAITLIPSIVIGPGDTRNTGKFLMSYVKGEFPGTFAEESVLPVVGVDDVARAHLLAYDRGRIGERYIISAQNITWGALLKIASAASGAPVPSRHIGGRALWLASRTGELFARVTRSPPRLPAWIADFLLTGAAMDNSKSVRELGMEYKPIADSIEAAIGWFREEGLVGAPRPSPIAVATARMPIENPPADVAAELASRALNSSQPVAAKHRGPKRPQGPT